RQTLQLRLLLVGALDRRQIVQQDGPAGGRLADHQVRQVVDRLEGAQRADVQGLLALLDRSDRGVHIGAGQRGGDLRQGGVGGRELCVVDSDLNLGLQAARNID